MKMINSFAPSGRTLAKI